MLLQQYVPQSPGAVAIFIRTYHGHLVAGDYQGGLRALLRSLIAQENENWAAFIFNSDRTPFADNGLRKLIKQLGDSRIMQLNDVAETAFDYWDAGYTGTDAAIAAVASWYGGYTPEHTAATAAAVGNVRLRASTGANGVAEEGDQAGKGESPFRWLCATNGDNIYSPQFLSHLDSNFDGIGVDFFSRWDKRALSERSVHLFGHVR